MKKIFFAILLLCSLFALASCRHSHTWGDWQIPTEPTCTEDGLKVRSCECGETQTATIHKSHKWDREICEEIQACEVCDFKQICPEKHTLDSTTGACRNCGIPKYSITASHSNEDQYYSEYTNKGEILYTFHVDDVICTVGTSNVTITVSGSKTACLYGDDYLAACKMIYKLFDSDGYVVASGYIDTIRLTVGDKVRNAKITLSGLPQWESYTLELYDIHPAPGTDDKVEAEPEETPEDTPEETPEEIPDSDPADDGTETE